MHSPFPGMDPYLERGSWSDFHTNLLVFLKGGLNRQLPPGFKARTEERLYIVPQEREVRPDVTVFAVSSGSRGNVRAGSVAVAERVIPPEIVLRPVKQVVERFIEIRDASREVVTVIEVLSPANKREGSVGREEYLRKQKSVLETPVNLVEIDLLRGGVHTVCIPRDSIAALGHFDYLVTRADATLPEEFSVWRIQLRDSLPIITVPLTPEAGTVELDLQEAFVRSWEESGYDETLDYSLALEPPLSPEDAIWVRERVESAL
jgi:Protein of unknown function (DUF4058)